MGRRAPPANEGNLGTAFRRTHAAAEESFLRTEGFSRQVRSLHQPVDLFAPGQQLVRPGRELSVFEGDRRARLGSQDLVVPLVRLTSGRHRARRGAELEAGDVVP